MHEDEFGVTDHGRLDLDIPDAAAARSAPCPRPEKITPLPPQLPSLSAADDAGEAWTAEDFERHGWIQVDPAGLNQDEYLLDPDPAFEPPPEDWPVPDPVEDDDELWLAGLPADVRADYLAGPWTGDGEAAGFFHRDPGLTGRGFAAGGALDTLDPGPCLAKAVTAATCGGHIELGESELIGVLCGWQRLISWAQAGQAVTLTALTDRREQQAGELDRPELFDHVDDEVAAALTLTGRSADRLLDTAALLARLTDVRAALSRGAIDWPRACLFIDQLAVLPADAAREIAAALIGRAGDMTTGQLRAALARAILAWDPQAAERRKETARRDAEVQVWAEPSGNAALTGRELRPAEVITASEQLTAHARWLKSCGADGTIDQLRAAAFIALLTGRPVHDLLPPEPDRRDNNAADPPAASPAPAASSGGPPLTGTINLTMPLSTWLGLADDPGEIAAHGPVDAATARHLAGATDRATRWCLTLTGTDGRVAAHACARTAPWRSADRYTGISWAASLKQRLQFLETAPCGHGRRSGSYQPPDSLRHLIEIRQRTCAFRGCRRPARRADLDHTVPYDKGGMTCECNLAPLCRRHHQAKQAHGWHLQQSEPGRLTWRTPSGRVYETTGDPY